MRLFSPQWIGHFHKKCPQKVSNFLGALHMYAFLLVHFFRLPNFANSRLVAKLTMVPKAAVRPVCNTSPSDILAQIEQMVPPIAETRMSLTLIFQTPSCAIFWYRCWRGFPFFRRRLLLLLYGFHDSQTQSYVF